VLRQAILNVSEIHEVRIYISHLDCICVQTPDCPVTEPSSIEHEVSLSRANKTTYYNIYVDVTNKRYRIQQHAGVRI